LRSFDRELDGVDWERLRRVRAGAGTSPRPGPGRAAPLLPLGATACTHFRGGDAPEAD